MKNYTKKEKIQYWLENKLSKSPLSFIKIIAIATVVLALLIAFFITIFISGSDFISSFWNTLASSINAWMPYTEDADNNVIHILLTSIAAIFGLFITSLLISIISSALEEKIEDIKKGNSIVVESNHIIIIGFVEGEYTLIKELIKSANRKELSIVVCCDRDKSEVEELIKDNVECPNNVRIICRTIQSITPTSLECCSVDTCKAVIISPMDDEKVIKYVYVLSYMLERAKRNDIVIVATIRNKEYLLPKGFNKGNNIIFLVLTDFVARIIARTCVQPGLSLAYLELFNNKGSELYANYYPNLVGKRFENIISCIDNGVPIGIVNDNETIINPKADYVISNDDKLVVFSEEKDSSIIVDDHKDIQLKRNDIKTKKEKKKKILILGYNESFETIINELSFSNVNIFQVGAKNENYIFVKKKTRNMKNIKILPSNISIDDYNDLVKLTNDIDRIVLLNNYSKNGDSADTKIMLRLTKLREIKEKYNRNFSICVELRRAANRTLIHKDDYTDYFVRTNLFSMFLSQLSMNPELKSVYDELLSYKGNEIMLLECDNSLLSNRKVSEIRNFLYKSGSIFLGILKNEDGKYNCIFNPKLDDIVYLAENDCLIVIKEKNTIIIK